MADIRRFLSENPINKINKYYSNQTNFIEGPEGESPD
jgi:hypothetical protein